MDGGAGATELYCGAAWLATNATQNRTNANPTARVPEKSLTATSPLGNYVLLRFTLNHLPPIFHSLLEIFGQLLHFIDLSQRRDGQGVFPGLIQLGFQLLRQLQQMSRIDLQLPLDRIVRERRFRLGRFHCNRLCGRRAYWRRRSRLHRRRLNRWMRRGSSLCRLPNLGRGMERRRLRILCVLILLVLLGALATRRSLRLAWGTGRQG
jgi:hypothetical protein